MSKKDILHLFSKHYGDRYETYLSSIKSEKKNYYFLVKDSHSKYLIVIGTCGICKDFEGLKDMIGAVGITLRPGQHRIGLVIITELFPLRIPV